MDPRELWGWSIRSVAVAWPSAMVRIWMRWSLLDVAAMATGVALFALMFAFVASSKWLRANDTRRRAWAALEGAVWVKASWMLLAILTLPLAFGSAPHGGWLWPFAVPFFLDEVTGAFSMAMAIGILGPIADGPHHESFLATLLVTLLQGAFIAVGLVPIALVVLAYRNWKQTREVFRSPF